MDFNVYAHTHTHTPMHHARVVEHYHKKQSYYIEEECKENELRVTSSGKPQDLASKAAQLMRVRLREGGRR